MGCYSGLLFENRLGVCFVSCRCVLCDGSKFHQFSNVDRDGKALDTVICGRCGLIRHKEIPSAAELSRFYEDHYRRLYKKSMTPKKKHAIRYFQRVTGHLSDSYDIYKNIGSTLDVGCGSGEYLFVTQKLGIHSFGIEPNKGYSKFMQENLGLQVLGCHYTDLSTNRQFDLIRLNHVLEHLPDPVSCLQKLKNNLSEDGLFYLSVPDFVTYCKNKSMNGLFHYAHIYNFDAYTFDLLLEKANLALVKRVGATSAFVKPGDCMISAREEDNVSINQAVYQQHLRGEFLPRKRRQQKLYAKIKRSLNEKRIARRFDSYEAIGHYYSDKLIHELNS